MQIKKVMPTDKHAELGVHRFTQEQLQVEYSYMQAEKITKKLLEKGLITEKEYEKIMAENRRTFPTFLSQIL